MKRYLHIASILWGGWLLLNSSLQAQEFNCMDDVLYLVLAGSGNSNSSLEQIVFNENGFPVVSTINSDLGVRLTGIGYNVRDNFIYGLDFQTNKLWKIDAQGMATDLGVPFSFQTDLEYRSGVVLAGGGRLMLIGKEAGNNTDQILASVNLLPPYQAGYLPVLSDDPIEITDMAIDPVLGTIMGWDNTNKRLANVSSGGPVTSVDFQAHPEIASLGSLFYDKAGNLFGYASFGSQENNLVLFDKFNGEILQRFNGPGGSFTDGCSCPFRLKLFKTVVPSEVVPCSVVTVIYKFVNTAGTSYGQKDFLDVFPPEFTITEIVKIPNFGEILSGKGTNQFEMTGMDILLGIDSLVLKVDVGNFSGTFEGQAFADGFPAGLGVEIPSDNPQTDIPDDPTPIKVLAEGEVILNAEPLLCPNGILLLTAASNGLDYTWSDGSKGETLEVTTPGWYWVEIQGNCGSFGDSVFVTEVEDPLFIDLGEDRIIQFGETLQLPYSTNGSAALQFRWAVSSADVLSCDDCPNPTAKPLEDATYSVTITDENGCTATDQLFVSLNKNTQIYAPNAFSPNGDGINDVFFLQGKGNLTVKSFRVFDRWGNLVFERREGQLNEMADGWDGKKRGRTLQTGVYVWFAEVLFLENNSEIFSGDILLLK